MTAVAELWRGSTVDTTNVTYKWAIMDSTVTATTSSGYDADFGTGWRKLSDTTGMYTGTTTATITIYAAAVDSYAVFRCVATDSDSTSATYNTDYTDVATFIDNSDPIQVVVTSTGGDVFKMEKAHGADRCCLPGWRRNRHRGQQALIPGRSTTRMVQSTHPGELSAPRPARLCPYPTPMWTPRLPSWS